MGFRVDDEDRDIDHVFEGAASGPQNCIQVVEGAPDLCLEIRLGRTILATADLPGNEQKSVRPNRRGIPVALIERLAPLGKNHITPHHDLPPSWTVGGPCLSTPRL